LKTLLLAATVGIAHAKDWAVIVAGSNTYGNYRHQADACHAYQIVHEWGIPDERVITFIYDDLVNSTQNPYPGQVFNKPTDADTPGVDVYAGCKIDYSGSDNNKENFLAVLTGDAEKTGGKPVLKSSADDNVFINFVDHGGTQSIAFPGMVLLSASDLNDALTTMYSQQMYSKLVFYLEACESGSMFENILSPDMNIYATTAANAAESSWGTYCPPDDFVQGKSIGSCLGDLYSVNWMEDCDAVGKKETLQDQFTKVQQLTDKSHVMQYGDTTFTDMTTGDFMGSKFSKPTKATSSTAGKKSSTVASRDIPVHLAYYKYVRTEKISGAESLSVRKAAAMELMEEIESRMKADEFFYNIASKMAAREMPAGTLTAEREELAEKLLTALPTSDILCTACCNTFQNAYQKHCGGYDDYSLQYERTVVNMCNFVNHQEAAFTAIAKDVEQMCTPTVVKVQK